MSCRQVRQKARTLGFLSPWKEKAGESFPPLLSRYVRRKPGINKQQHLKICICYNLKISICLKIVELKLAILLIAIEQEKKITN